MGEKNFLDKTGVAHLWAKVLNKFSSHGCFVDEESEMAGNCDLDNAARCILVPENAEVGQTIVVSAVDENGRPTEWALVNVSDMVTESDKTEIAESAAALVDNELLSVIGEVSA